MKRGTSAVEKSGIQLAEEAVMLLRGAPAGVMAAYYVGSLPFVLSLLYYWTDMSRGAFAGGRCAGAALGLSLVFIWMKCWHAVFCARLRALVEQRPESAWSLRRIGRMILAQAALQPAGLVVIPLALLAAVPFGWAHTYYQNLSICGTGEDSDLGALRNRAWRLARLWPFQNHLVIWLLSPWLAGAAMLIAFGVGWIASMYNATTGYENPFAWFLTGTLIILVLIWPSSPLGFVLTVNAALLMVIVPYGIKSLLGYELMFTLSNEYSVVNTTFLAALYGVVYLCMDPFLKAACVLRCFYGESIATGDDLKIEVRSLRTGRIATWAALGLLLFAVPTIGIELPAAEKTVPAAQPSVAPAEIDRIIQEVLQRDEFRWRMPRINPEENDPKNTGLIGSFFAHVEDFILSVGAKADQFVNKVLQWLNKHLLSKFRWDPGHHAESNPWNTPVYVILFVLLAIVLSALAILLWRNRRKSAAVADVSAQAVPLVDLEREDVSADRLPADEWMAWAAEMLRRGEYRLAVRALFLSSLAHLAQNGAIRISSFKSNHDYLRDLRRRAHALPELFAAFTTNVEVFDRIWYGQYPATEDTVHSFETNIQRIRRYAGGWQ
jgi:hypothetical protein